MSAKFLSVWVLTALLMAGAPGPLLAQDAGNQPQAQQAVDDDDDGENGLWGLLGLLGLIGLAGLRRHRNHLGTTTTDVRRPGV